MRLDNFKDLFTEQLMDAYDAERQLVEALPKIAEACSHKELEQAVRQHLKETKEHVHRIETICNDLQVEPDKQACEAMRGILKEGSEVIEEDGDEAVKDAAIIASAQRVEHYEMACYGTLRTFAEQLGLENAVSLLDRTLQEERATDQKLTEIARSVVNPEALQTSGVGQGQDQDQEREQQGPSRQSNSSRPRSQRGR